MLECETIYDFCSSTSSVCMWQLDPSSGMCWNVKLFMTFVQVLALCVCGSLIRVAPTGINKMTKKLLRPKLPDLGKFSGMEEFVEK